MWPDIQTGTIKLVSIILAGLLEGEAEEKSRVSPLVHFGTLAVVYCSDMTDHGSMW